MNTPFAKSTADAAQALRAEGIESFPEDNPAYAPLWDKLLRFTGNKTKHELLTDIGLGKRIANIVAKRMVNLLSEAGERPDALLLTRERFTASVTFLTAASWPITVAAAVPLAGATTVRVMSSARCCIRPTVRRRSWLPSW